jgi:hypothetical protein
VDNPDIQFRIVRFHNIYGPHGTWKGGREKAPAAFLRKVPRRPRRCLLALRASSAPGIALLPPPHAYPSSTLSAGGRAGGRQALTSTDEFEMWGDGKQTVGGPQFPATCPAPIPPPTRQQAGSVRDAGRWQNPRHRSGPALVPAPGQGGGGLAIKPPAPPLCASLLLRLQAGSSFPGPNCATSATSGSALICPHRPAPPV